MIYEATIQFVKIDNKGNDRSVKQSFAIENKETFAEVEYKLYEEFEGYTGLDVIAIKRSKAKEVANTRTYDDERIWEAIVKDVYTDDDGEETEMKYKILFFAKGVNNAMNYITEYLKQGFDMQLVALKETSLCDVIV